MSVRGDINRRRVIEAFGAFRGRYEVSPTLRELADESGLYFTTVWGHVQTSLEDGVLRQAAIPGKKPDTARTLLPGPRYDAFLQESSEQETS